MAGPVAVVDIMVSMQEHGIPFAPDNFGAGASFVKHFCEFFFDAVKIDGQFIRGVHANHDNQAVARALVSVAKQFDMLVVAESVETREDAEFLLSIGVDCLQGFLFGAPSVSPPWIEDLKERSRA